MNKPLIALFCLAVLTISSQISIAGEIHEAAKSGDVAKLKNLLDKDPGLMYVKDEQGKTALHWAVGRGQTEAVKLLLDVYHADVNVRNDNLGTPLHVAASQAQPEAARMLIAHNASIDARAKNGSTPLHFAAFKGREPGHIETARILLENKADPNARTDEGATPLAMAIRRDNAEIVKLLREYGAKGGSQAAGQRKTIVNMTQD